MIKRNTGVCSRSELNPGSFSDLKSSVVYDHAVLRPDYAIQGKWLRFPLNVDFLFFVWSMKKI